MIAAVASAALRGDLEMLKDIIESNDCTIFISPGVGVEEASLPDVLEQWPLGEYPEYELLKRFNRVIGLYGAYRNYTIYWLNQ